MLFTPKLRPLSLSFPDMGAFIPFLGQKVVNEIDAKQQHHVGKLADAVHELLLERGYAWHHIYQSFCFELPGEVYVQLLNHPAIKVSAVVEGSAVSGIMSGSFSDWVVYIPWLKTQKAELEIIGDALLSYFIKYEPFRNFTLKGLVPR